MAEAKQSLQETGSKERESYKSVFLKKQSVCNRQSVYISGEIHYGQKGKHREFH